MANTALTAGRAQQLQKLEEASALSVLEFESPSGALMTVPVVGSARSVTWLLAVMVIALLAAATLLPMNMQVTATGRVIPTAESIAVQPLDLSIVKSINVREGQIVHAGDVLARLDPTLTGADLSQYKGDVEVYQATVDELTAEANRVAYEPKTANSATAVQAALFGEHTAQYRSTMDGYNQKIAGLQATLAQADADIQGYQMRLQLASQLEEIRVKLEKMQVGSAIDRLSAQDQRVEMARYLATAVATAQQAQANIKEMVQERLSFDKQWFAQIASSLTDATRNLNDAKANLTKAQLHRQVVDMKAPVDAIVLNVAQVSVGSVLQPSATLMQLTPLDSPMELDTMVAGQDAGWVHPGQPVTIQFNSYPYVRFGTAEGTVRFQSPDSFTSITGPTQQGVAMMAPGTPTMPYYDARITVDKIKMHGIPGGFHLRPGMPVTVQIQTGQRTVFEYIMERALPVAEEGMREPS